MKMHRSGMVWSCWIVLMLTTSPLPAVEVRPALENKITQALKKRIAVNFRAIPLSEAIEQLATEAGVPYRLEWPMYAENAVKPDTPVTLQREEQEIAETLLELLGPMSLSYELNDDTLSVTAEGEQILRSRFFDVSRLVELIKPRLTTEPVSDSTFGVGGGGGFFGVVPENADSQPERMIGLCAGSGGVARVVRRKADFRIPLKNVQHRLPAEHRLMTLIQENTWGQWQEIDMVGGTITASPGRLLLRQTHQVHQQAFVVLSNLEMMLGDLKQYPRLRLGESEDERRVRAALDRILDIVSDAPAGTMSLQAWMDANIRAHGVAIRVDQFALEDEGIDWKEVKVALTPGVSRRKLFQDALIQAHLSLVFFNGRFVITSLVKADEALTTMIYDIGGLPEAGDFDWLADFLYSTTSGQWEMVDGVGGTLSTNGLSGLLIVRQTENVLEEVAKQLDELRHPLEIPAKPLQPARTHSIYALPDVAIATDLQAILPKLVQLPDVTWPDDSIQRVGSMLIVQQTEVAHRRIETVVEALLKTHQISTGVKQARPVSSPDVAKETQKKP